MRFVLRKKWVVLHLAPSKEHFRPVSISTSRPPILARVRHRSLADGLRTMQLVMSCRRIQEVLLDVGGDGNGCGVDLQRRRDNKEISQSSRQRQTERRPPTRVDVPFSHGLQHESCQEVSVAGRSECTSEEQEKASDRYIIILNILRNLFTTGTHLPSAIIVISLLNKVSR